MIAEMIVFIVLLKLWRDLNFFDAMRITTEGSVAPFRNFTQVEVNC